MPGEETEAQIYTVTCLTRRQLDWNKIHFFQTQEPIFDQTSLMLPTAFSRISVGFIIAIGWRLGEGEDNYVCYELSFAVLSFVKPEFLLHCSKDRCFQQAGLGGVEDTKELRYVTYMYQHSMIDLIIMYYKHGLIKNSKNQSFHLFL